MSAATNITWKKFGVQLYNESFHTFEKIIREGSTSTYDNLLFVYQTNINELPGNYSCSVQNAFGRATQSIILTGKRACACIGAFLIPRP